MINNSPQENNEHEKQDCDRTRLTKTSWTVNQNEQARKWIFIGYYNNTAVFPARCAWSWGVILYTSNCSYGIIILWRQERESLIKRGQVRRQLWNYLFALATQSLNNSCNTIIILFFLGNGDDRTKSFKYSMSKCIVSVNLIVNEIEVQSHWQLLKKSWRNDFQNELTQELDKMEALSARGKSGEERGQSWFYK